jgi:hypothetical protein
MDGDPRRKLLNGKPVSCRTCKFVMDPRFPYEVTENRVRVVCCRIAPPSVFVWTNMQIEPFCGQHAPEEGTAPADPRLAPLAGEQPDVQAFDDDAMIPMYGAPVPSEKVPPGLKRRR